MIGCSDPTPADDHHDDGDESIGSTSSALEATDSVATAVNQTCGTAAVKGLAIQLVEEINCLRPDTTKRIDNTPGIALATGAAAVPFLQKATAESLEKAQKARGVTMTINSGLRTL